MQKAAKTVLWALLLENSISRVRNIHSLCYRKVYINLAHFCVKILVMFLVVLKKFDMRLIELAQVSP